MLNSLTEDSSLPAWLAHVTFNQDGLIPAIAQDHHSGEILMMAWMNAEALTLTAQSKTAVYFSRSRNKLWHKGETSGHTQKVHDIYLDCDADVIVLSVTQVGGIACHTGRQSCFYRRLDCSGSQPTWQTVAPILKDPESIYGEGTAHSESIQTDNEYSDTQADTNHVLQQLDAVLAERKQADADTSYVASLYHKGLNKILEKVGEEAVECIIAAKDFEQIRQKMASLQENDTANTSNDILDAQHELIYEIADVWFHTLVTLAWFNIGSERILAELARRFGLSGLAEKASRDATK